MAKTYHILVIQGKLRTAVQWITYKENGGGYCSRMSYAPKPGRGL